MISKLTFFKVGKLREGPQYCLELKAMYDNDIEYGE